MTKGPYTPEFSPVARKDHAVELDFGDSSQTYRIVKFAPLPAIEQSITVDANDVERDVDLDQLETWDGWFAQYRLPRLTEELPDSVSLEFDQGGSQAPLYQNLNQRGAITNETPYQQVTDPADSGVDIHPLIHLLEMFVFEQETPKVTVTNDTASKVTVGLTFAGWQYQIQQVESVGEQPVYIPVESVRGN